jgi:hypothetical protein
MQSNLNITATSLPAVPTFTPGGGGGGDTVIDQRVGSVGRTGGAQGTRLSETGVQVYRVQYIPGRGGGLVVIELNDKNSG